MLSSIINHDKIKTALENAATITKRNLIKFYDSTPNFETQNMMYPYSKNDVYQRNITHWQDGFWAGIIWLLYEFENKDYVRCYGEKITSSISKKIEKSGLIHSNLGFLVIPSCMASYKLTGNNSVIKPIISAAKSLISKYDPISNFVCAYEDELEGKMRCCIISNLINNILLDIAYRFSGNIKYRDAAENDRYTVIKNNIKSNGKTYFGRFYDIHTGSLIKSTSPLAYYKDKGTETRAYAFALYGLAINYHWTKNELFKERFCTVIKYLNNKTQKKEIYNSRLNESEQDQYEDSISTAIIANALLIYLKDNNLTNCEYAHMLSNIVNILIDKYSSDSKTQNEGLLLNIRRSNNTSTTFSNLIGDYFYFELLMNLMYDRDSFWF